MTKRRRSYVAAVAGAVALVMAGCSAGSSGNGPSSNGFVESLTFPADVSNTIGGLVNYNPYSPNPLVAAMLYEPLVISNGLSCEVTPGWRPPTGGRGPPASASLSVTE